MKSITRYEVSVLGVLVVVLLAASIPSLLYARQERRDGIRRDELRQRKHAMEMYYNEHEIYPLKFDASPHQHVVDLAQGRHAVKWYLRAELENTAAETAGFDEEYNMYYRIVREGERTFFDICGGELRCGQVTE